MQETQETLVRSLGREDPLEEDMATHSSIYSCLKNPMYRGAWQAIIHMVTKSQTGLSTTQVECIVDTKILQGIINKMKGVSSKMHYFRTPKISRAVLASLVEHLKFEHTPSMTFLNCLSLIILSDLILILYSFRCHYVRVYFDYL